MSRHSWYPERNGRNSTPYKTAVESKSRIEDGKRITSFRFYRYENGIGLWNGYVDENGNVVSLGFLESKIGEDPDKILSGNRVLLRITDGRWKTIESFVSRQVEVGKIRMEQRSLNYRRNGYVYEQVEKINSHPWSPRKCLKGTDLFYPGKELMTYEEYYEQAKAEGR